MSDIIHDFYKELIESINILLTNFNSNDTITTFVASY